MEHYFLLHTYNNSYSKCWMEIVAGRHCSSVVIKPHSLTMNSGIAYQQDNREITQQPS